MPKVSQVPTIFFVSQNWFLARGRTEAVLMKLSITLWNWTYCRTFLGFLGWNLVPKARLTAAVDLSSPYLRTMKVDCSAEMGESLLKLNFWQNSNPCTGCLILGSLVLGFSVLGLRILSPRIEDPQSWDYESLVLGLRILSPRIEDP